MEKSDDFLNYSIDAAASGRTGRRKIILELSVSRDGFIEGPHGELDWLAFHWRSSNFARFMSAFDTIFYGRRAYERLGILPFIDDSLSPVDVEFYSTLYGMRKYVFSRTRKHVAGNGMVVRENLESEVRRILGEEGKNIWICGGADIVKTFARLDLIDEYRITVHPVTLYSGKPLFEGKWPLNLTLIEKHSQPSGRAVLHYLPDTRLNTIHHGRSF